MFEPECSNSRLPKSKKAEFTGVIEHFFDEDNEEVGHYRPTLIGMPGDYTQSHCPEKEIQIYSNVNNS